MFPSMPARMSPERAWDLGRLYQALSEQLEVSGSRAHAQRAMLQAQWWLTYAVS